MRLPQLHASYQPCTFAYSQHASCEPPVTALQWIEVFRSSTPTFVKYAREDESVPDEKREAAVAVFEQTFHQALGALAAKFTGSQSATVEEEPLNCIALCQLREDCLTAAGFGDIFHRVKEVENTAALAVLPGICKQIDDNLDASKRIELAIHGVLAGNIFDLGAAASADLFDQNGAAASFARTCCKLLPRPWVVDDLDLTVQRMSQAGYKKALLFVDNAGSDVVLGMLPFARELLKLGTKVVLAANQNPTINDITAAELSAVLKEAAALDTLLGQTVKEGKLTVVSSGSSLPVIDLRCLSSEIVECAQDVDLIVLEGMGRSIETNLEAKLTCDSLRIGMVKHPEIATCLGGRLYDCVCKFIPGSL